MSLAIDKSTWKRVAFGDVVRNVNDYYISDVDGVLPYVAGPHISPGEVTVQGYGATDDDQFPPTFKRKFAAGDVLLHSRGIEKLAAVDRIGVTGEKLFVLRTVDEHTLDQNSLVWLMLSPTAQSHMRNNFTGSVNKFLNWKPLAAFEFDLPPLDEQKRIADLLWAVERHGEAVRRQRAIIAEALGRYAAHRLSQLPSTVRLGDITTTRSGPSFAASSVHESAVEGSIPVLGIPNTRPDGTMDLTKVGHVTGLPSSVGTVDHASLVLIRTNGNRNRIGNVYLPPVEAYGHAVSAFQFLMRAADPRDREYLYWVLKEPSMQRRMSDGASGSVGLGNLAVRWLNEQRIPWSSSSAEREVIVTDLKCHSAALATLDGQADALATLRSSLLFDIFGGK